MSKRRKPRTIGEIILDGTEIQRALGEAARQARRYHKLLGHPIIVWRDGRVVAIPPEEIVVDEREAPPVRAAPPRVAPAPKRPRKSAPVKSRRRPGPRRANPKPE